MKPRLSIILSAIALIVLLIVQYYNISVTFQTKKEQFDNRYGAIVKQALYEYESGATGYLSDSVFVLFDNISEELVFQSGQVPGGLATDSLQQQILASYSRILQDHTSPDGYLQDYLVEAGADPDFRSGYYIRELSLLDFDRIIPVYNDTTGQRPASMRNALHANTYAFEGNYFRIRYDYYIDFTHKTQIIYRDMVITFILAVVTIMIVLFVFFMTMRNMLIQKRLSDMKTDFINNMTHELKTPLSTIAVASSTLGDETLLKDKKKVLQISEMIKKQNKHLTELIDRILEISIWEKDHVKLKKKSVHVYEFIEDRINLFRIENTGKDLRINTEYKLDKDFISLDEIHMTTVLNNLLSNAVKYCEGKPEINVEVSLNMKLKIRIRDNGIGISKEDQRHIFDKFYRAGKGDFKTVKGLGLGLYYVKQIVTAHHGEIFLHSQPGKGSTFTIDIPLNYEHPAG
ncbi:MAG: HAMP domain-containing histidine kinase [Bacteroidales bacterium]|nr:HAMP domain-containing histidine kinase [Bacteroidales bacterium]